MDMIGTATESGKSLLTTITNGSEVTIALQAFNSRVGVSLKIDTKNETSTVSLPACIEVVGAGD